MPSLFVTFEGIEGVGKSTQIQALKDYFSKIHQPCITTREPGGTAIAEKIRAILLEKSDEVLSHQAELLLLFAARLQHLHDLIEPALARGDTVLCDRFIDATYAYQVGGRGIEPSVIESIEKAFIKTYPTHTIWLDMPVDLALQRTRSRGALDRFEEEKYDFFERCQKAYAERAKEAPDRIIRIEADGSVADTSALMLDALKSRGVIA